MSVLSKCFFCLSACLLLYAYCGYSFLLVFVVKLLKRRHLRDYDFRPPVTIVVPAYNEEKVIRKKIENCLALDYPDDKLEILVCSDCSTDSTAAIVEEHFKESVRFLDYQERSGKTGILNKSIPKAKGEIVVLTDANTMLERHAILKLVSMYTSERVGAVLGEVNLVVPGGGRGVGREVTYRDFEANLKYHEGLLGAAIGAFGGLYSIRKDLYVKLPDNAYSNDDFLAPMNILMNGYRVLFDRESISTEDTGVSVAEEFGRRIRIGAGNFQSFFLLPGMLNPLRGIPFVLYLSHKVLRWFSPMILLAVFCSNLPLRDEFPFNMILWMQIAFYCVALFGAVSWCLRITVPVGSSVFHFVSMNVAVLLGFLRYLRGIRSAVWSSTEREVS